MTDGSAHFDAESLLKHLHQGSRRASRGARATIAARDSNAFATQCSFPTAPSFAGSHCTNAVPGRSRLVREIHHERPDDREHALEGIAMEAQGLGNALRRVFHGPRLRRDGRITELSISRLDAV